MKLVAALFTLAGLATSVIASTTYSCPVNYAPVVRLLLSKPVSLTDKGLIEDAINPATRRNLRVAERNLWPSDCNRICNGVDPAQCFWRAYYCTVGRRAESEVDDAAEVNYRELELDSCLSEVNAVATSIADVLQDVSNKTASLLADATTSCFCLPAGP